MRGSVWAILCAAVVSVSFADTDEAGKIALKVIESTIEAPGIERQCRGTFVVKNIGPAFRKSPNIVGLSYGVFIYDKRGKLLFRNFGAWGVWSQSPLSRPWFRHGPRQTLALAQCRWKDMGHRSVSTRPMRVGRG